MTALLLIAGSVSVVATPMIQIIKIQRPMDLVKRGLDSPFYYIVHLDGTNKHLDPDENDFIEGPIFLFLSEEEAEKAIARYHGGSTIYGAL